MIGVSDSQSSFVYVDAGAKVRRQHDATLTEKQTMCPHVHTIAIRDDASPLPAQNDRFEPRAAVSRPNLLPRNAANGDTRVARSGSGFSVASATGATARLGGFAA